MRKTKQCWAARLAVSSASIVNLPPSTIQCGAAILQTATITPLLLRTIHSLAAQFRVAPNPHVRPGLKQELIGEKDAGSVSWPAGQLLNNHAGRRVRTRLRTVPCRPASSIEARRRGRNLPPTGKVPFSLLIQNPSGEAWREQRMSTCRSVVNKSPGGAEARDNDVAFAARQSISPPICDTHAVYDLASADRGFVNTPGCVAMIALEGVCAARVVQRGAA